MAETKKKVMDISKPGYSKPDIGSKPMVVGHKSYISDPAIKQSKTNQDSQLEDKKPPSSKLRLEPISNSKLDNKEADPDIVSKTDKTVTTNEDSKTNSTSLKDINSNEDSSETEKSSKVVKDDIYENKHHKEMGVPATDDDQAKKVSSDKVKKKDEGDIQLERQQHLQEIVQSKKYFVDIKEANGRALRKFFLTFFVVTILGVLILVVLMDAEILDLGVKLPFNLIK